MNWIDKLERKYRHLAIENLMYYIIGLSTLVYGIYFITNSYNLISLLELDPALVMQGQVWRLITYIFIPPLVSPIWIFFRLYIYYSLGSALEHEWGSFKFNLYYLLGMIGTTIVSFILNSPVNATYLNLSIFLAFAKIYPDYEFYLFFILPVKVKYLSFLNWIYIGYTIIFSPVIFKLTAIVSIINYFIFFGKSNLYDAKNKRNAYNRKKQFKSNITNINRKDYFHKCTVCGITEKDDKNIEFRYCSKCNGDYEYCINHLNNHEHK
ncbi:rhomboid family intramembrane serine protease [Tepidibacter mesophilus]|uniref:rhomboid family intramembrane serine protease n=1 Tax=Tepidibacter mesophilus TaxID=655607 RepID=UPI000C072BFE|nr:rhomboid family intramembrane serine protease [Tepidibacter mesophilus]